ncbi:hypothetical protein MF628_08605 [Paenibacillus polymyxa]|uniref:hypothetical protein n=1 Tax=Paenibacillus polymyxa TaxID=1406 RepID=UPI0020245DCA|nr:hypothetical protein [Paenibacillus polymyxa]WDZ63422.1 hypothetical protein MF628_08605 [Paenibacillus polymyxa]
MMNITIEQENEVGLEQIKLEKYLAWCGPFQTVTSLDEHIEGVVLHESEFLQVVVRSVAGGRFLTEEYVRCIGTDFLALATGVEQRVFDVLVKLNDVEAIRSIIEATAGILDFSRKALEYYGISRFVTITSNACDMYALGDGYYYFNQA